VSLPIAFRREARVEFDRAHDWYEDKRPRLGEEFSERVRIAALPELHQCVYKTSVALSFKVSLTSYSTA